MSNTDRPSISDRHEVNLKTEHELHITPTKMNNSDEGKTSQISDDSKKYSSSTATVFAVVNCMVGSVILLLPINFGNTGLIYSLILMTIIGSISYFTCAWVIRNSRFDEQHMSQVIARLLGQKWLTLFNIMSFLLMFTVGIVIFLLINSSFFQVMQYILNKIDVPHAASDAIDFSQYSMQWQCIGIMCIFIPLFFFKNIKVFINMSKYGAICIYCYFAFIIYAFVDNLISGRIAEHGVKMGTTNMKDISFLIGNMATSFIIHHEITQLMSTNKNKKNNTRDVGISYLLVAVIMGCIGSLGAMGLVGRRPMVKSPITIYDYFEGDNIISFMIACLFFTQQFTVLPWFNYTSREHFFGLIYGKGKQIPKKYLILYNIVYIVFSLITQILMVDPNYIIGIVGAVIGFVMVYLIPIQIRDQSYYESIGQIDLNDHDQQKHDKEIQYKVNSAKKDSNIHSCQNLDDEPALSSKQQTKATFNNMQSMKTLKTQTELHTHHNLDALELVQAAHDISDKNKVTKLSGFVKTFIYTFGIFLMLVQLMQIFVQI